MTEQTLTFRTGLGTRLADSCVAVFLGLAIALLGLLLPIGVGKALVDAGAPVWAVVAGGIVVVLLAWRFAWRLAVFRLRFRLVFHLDYLEIGGGWLRRRFAYEEIDEVRLPGLKEHGTWLKLWSGSTCVRIILDSNDVSTCWKLLGQLCPNAVFVDTQGNEHIRFNEADPIRSLLALERQQRRSYRRFLWAGTMLTVLGGLRTAAGVRALLGQMAGGLGIALTLFTSVVLLSLGIGALVHCWRAFQTARQARKQRLALTAGPVPDPLVPTDRTSLFSTGNKEIPDEASPRFGVDEIT